VGKFVHPTELIQAVLAVDVPYQMAASEHVPRLNLGHPDVDHVSEEVCLSRGT